MFIIMTTTAAIGDHLDQWHLQEVQQQIGGKSSSQVQANIYTGLVQSLCLQNLHSSEHCVEKLKPQFWEGCHAGVQFQWNKNHLQNPIRWESRDFSCHSTEPTQKAWKPQFWPADFTFPSMAAALYLCPKLVNLSRSSCLHVTFKWFNHMQLAQIE